MQLGLVSLHRFPGILPGLNDQHSMSGIISAMQPLTHQSDIYQVVTPVYEGPLDLILQLIEKAELDITKLALAQVTDQYLAHLRHIPDTNAGDVSSFLVIASKLVQIKSEALLPRPPVREPGEEDPGEALARQLILYKRFKEISEGLAARMESFHTYPRLAPAPDIESPLDLRGLSLDDLVLAAKIVLKGKEELLGLSFVVAPARVTIREKILRIADFLKRNPRGSFSALIEGSPRRLDIVVTFLALLELIKLRRVLAYQEGLFYDITMELSSVWDEAQDIELEFGE